tara:strand:+ start:886 stop:1146 length:261 start_codon:yes stop_codon:yes gene_type:complete
VESVEMKEELVVGKEETEVKVGLVAVQVDQVAETVETDSSLEEVVIEDSVVVGLVLVSLVLVVEVDSVPVRLVLVVEVDSVLVNKD